MGPNNDQQSRPVDLDEHHQHEAKTFPRTPLHVSPLSRKRFIRQKSKTTESAGSKKLQNALKHPISFDQCSGMIAIGSSGMRLVVAPKPLKAKYLSGDPQRLTMPNEIMIARRVPPAYFDEFMGIPVQGVRLKKVPNFFEVSGALDPFKLGTGLAPSQAGTIADIRGRT